MGIYCTIGHSNQTVPDETLRGDFQVASDLAGALVYLDEGAGEAAHFTLGLRYLLGLGVVNVCSLKTAKASDAVLSSTLQSFLGFGVHL